ncbi:J domain-containing protein [Spiroplasma endosymbiont of Atherix ibis]|uniref:J domain-containing protein n=1 Tax=Spiroplasma endosymbiont of Atherix ibis TaxID=3066291 RepID=UPI0030D044D9
MDELLRFFLRILNAIFIVLIIDMIFGGRKRRNGGKTRNLDNSQSRYSDEDTVGGADYDQSQSYSDFYQGYSQLDQAYQALGLVRGCSLKEVKKRYIELAKKNHPDKNPNNVEAQAEMTKINNAYETIVEDFNRIK